MILVKKILIEENSIEENEIWKFFEKNLRNSLDIGLEISIPQVLS